MEALGAAIQDRTSFGCLAERNDQVELCQGDFLDRFRPLSGNINADFFHDLNGEGVDGSGFRPGAVYGDRLRR